MNGCRSTNSSRSVVLPVSHHKGEFFFFFLHACYLHELLEYLKRLLGELGENERDMFLFPNAGIAPWWMGIKTGHTIYTK